MLMIEFYICKSLALQLIAVKFCRILNRIFYDIIVVFIMISDDEWLKDYGRKSYSYQINLKDCSAQI